jgi:hypothetical protein
MRALADFKATLPRFSRSISLERDATGGGHALDGYLPVGRAIEVIDRLATALRREHGEVALSITGPYGSGKSSLALLIDAVLGPAGDPGRLSAEDLLTHAAPKVMDSIRAARAQLGAEQSGFVRAVVTAQREPIGATILRALDHGFQRYRSAGRNRSAFRGLSEQIAQLQRSLDRGTALDLRVLRRVIEQVCEVAPLLILIDEFGKNLEAFADLGASADLFVLQELAEWTAGERRLPLALVTLQHMAFDEYADGATGVQRREWAKVQGRFDDIPFVDTPSQTQSLIPAAFTATDRRIAPSVKAWSEHEAGVLAGLGVHGFMRDPESLAACWPLHPFVVFALPDLCARYGQNERTLFSFLAGPGPDGVAAFLSDTAWQSGSDLPVVRLDRVYDYFVASAAGLVGVSASASRWLEIDTRIRDALGIGEPSQRVLKTVGLLNLVSAGGSLRASRAVVCAAVADGHPGTRDHRDVAARLVELEKAGLLTWRDFADEYRVWQGSDFDLKTAIHLGRRRMLDQSPSKVLSRVLPLDPLVAARHSHQTGTLRAFERGWVDADVDSIAGLTASDRGDGLALYVLGPEPPTDAVHSPPGAKPVTFVVSPNTADLLDAAREVAAIDEVLASGGDVDADWVARRELLERRVEARLALDREFQSAYSSAGGAAWHWSKPRRSKWQAFTASSPSAVLSTIADAWYNQALVIHNDLVNRNDLSSQAAKARRVLIEAMLRSPSDPNLGIEGFGPERSMYMSVLEYLGLHEESEEGWLFTIPSEDRCKPVWEHLVERMFDASSARLRVSDLYEALAIPPFGLRAGVAPILLVAALIIYAEDIALYEHGTFRSVLAPEMCERLLRNPENFELKSYAARAGLRATLLTAVADRLRLPASRGPRNGRVGSVLAVVSRLVATVNGLPEFTRKTRSLSKVTLAIRRAIESATEPDELMFKAIPAALGHAPISVTGELPASRVSAIANGLSDALDELQNAYASLLSSLREALKTELRGADGDLRTSLGVRAREIQGSLIDPRIARLVVALSAELPGEEEWLEYVALNVSGASPAGWTDEDLRRFFTVLHDVGGTFRRIEALNADVRSRGDGFDALRVTVTRPDGAESAKLVWVDESRRAAIRPVLEQALSSARGQVESDEEARELLLALLAEWDLGDLGEVAERDDRPEETRRLAHE